MVVPMRNCCSVFTLRQSTMLIAIVELLLTAIILFLLLLGSAHAQEIARMLRYDITDSEERQGTEPEDIDFSMKRTPITNNELQLQTAEHELLVTIISIYTGIAMVTIHLISCVMLLYGAIMQVRQLLAPWIGVVFVGMIVVVISLIAYGVTGEGSTTLFVCTGLAIQIRFCQWMVVFSYYRQLVEASNAPCSATTVITPEATCVTSANFGYPEPLLKPSEV
ncbi:uncharacterized protein LOC124595742 [Schistocerca americana]|uniref:uncharacterized protein LOC124595742 n=1 Tax=Schistocerca americana TaxID=7009 RepID=UPI001F4FA826|nr:uncharacterized protein LOC124595742 [Schistocerca americana]XP_047108943.1 uncharacterized protein LOC124777536 [Schistocerca piceifrons]XP_049798973.1 uncharacterized protein LOC126234331 [Schistocerca nitens]XP_049854220.1 uncharacterized protein LOC126335225 [Schistocerca gregaria]XP_049854221.1 uncharacterized protein LOC126335225 [Schistocerca gregaria]XP_049948246.1 uncharacterized protein LOC126456541 [Schistocerca serialis cubense]